MFGYKEQLNTAIKQVIDETQWTPERIGFIPDEFLDDVDPIRHRAARARASCIRKVLKPLNLQGQGLEFGAGRGEVSRLFETAGIQLAPIPSDVNLSLLSRLDKPNRLLMDINNPAFADSSFGWIIDMNAIDQFLNPDMTLKQVLGLLKPGGFFIHFQDLQPDEFVIAQRHADEILIPVVGTDDIRKIPYVAFSKKEAEKFGSLLPPNSAELWNALCELDPLKRTIATRIIRPTHIPVLLHNLTYLHAINKLSFQPRIMDLVEDFHQSLISSMGQAGFVNSEVLMVCREENGSVLEGQQPHHWYQYAFSRSKTLSNPSVKGVRETATVMAIIGQKPK